MTDLAVRPVLIVAGSVVATVLIAAAFVSWLVGAMGGVHDAPTPAAANATRLESDPVKELADYRTAKMQELNGYGWLDDAHETAHVPIERAMQMLVEDSAHDGAHR